MTTLGASASSRCTTRREPGSMSSSRASPRRGSGSSTSPRPARLSTIGRLEAVHDGRILYQDPVPHLLVGPPVDEQVEEQRVVRLVLLGGMRPVATPHAPLGGGLGVGAGGRRLDDHVAGGPDALLQGPVVVD